MQIIEPELAENATMGPAMTEFRGPNARTIMRLASDVFAKHQVREIC